MHENRTEEGVMTLSRDEDPNPYNIGDTCDLKVLYNPSTMKSSMSYGLTSTSPTVRDVTVQSPETP